LISKPPAYEITVRPSQFC